MDITHVPDVAKDLPKLNILIINYEFPPLGGGGGNASYFVARELTKMGHTVAVLTSTFGDLPVKESLDGFTVYRLKVRRKRIDGSNVFEMAHFIIKGLTRIESYAHEFKPDKLVAFFSLPSGPLAYHLKRKLSIPYDIYLQGGDVPGFAGIGLLANITHFMLKGITRRIWSSADNVVANSTGLAELASKTWPGPIKAIPNGVDTDFFKPASSRKNTQRVSFLFVGRFSEQKGLIPFLGILDKFSSPTDWQFIIVGDGPLRSDVENKIRNSDHLAARVVLKGWLSKTELLTQYQRADFFVLPSLDEGMPNVLTEAMACGLPVLATAVAGSNELVINGITGFLYPAADNPVDLLRQLIEGVDLRRSMGSAGRRIAESMGWSTIAKAILKNSTLKSHLIND